MTRLTLPVSRLAAGLALVGLVAPQAVAQFVTANNYQPPAQQYRTAYQPYQAAGQPYQVGGQQPPATAPVAAAQPYQAAQPSYQPTVQPATQPAVSQPTATYAAAPGQVATTYPYPRVAQTSELPAPTESAPAQAIEPIPGAAPAASAMPYDGGYQGATTYSAPATTTSGGCATGNCGATPTQHVMAAPATQSAPCDYGAAATNYCGPAVDYSYAPTGCDLGGSYCAAPARPRRQWFVGLYGLYMERDNPGKAITAFRVEDESAIVTPYYPPATVDFISTSQTDVDGEFGGEVRFGSTFGCADPCGGGQPFAWEIGYWALGDNESQTSSTITTAITGAAPDPRIYGAMNYGGLEYDRDAGGTWTYRPLNDYYDYQSPVENNAPDDIRVLGVRIRQRFEVQNLELNFWRFGHPVASPGLGVGGGRLAGIGGVGGTCGAGGCGGGACGVGGCNAGACGVNACGSCRPPRRFFINGLAGVRFFRTDEFWQSAIQFTTVDGTGEPTGGADGNDPSAYTGFPVDDDNVIFHDVEVDNQLVGFQLGCSMNWLVGCKWNFFCDSNFGVYNNDTEVYQRVFSGGDGTIRFVNGGADAAVRTSRQDVAFLGEARLGAGYQISCNCRLTAAYRLMAVSGVALGVEQVPASFNNSQVLNHIDNNDSLVLHGLQSGVEWKY